MIMVRPVKEERPKDWTRLGIFTLGTPLISEDSAIQTVGLTKVCTDGNHPGKDEDGVRNTTREVERTS